MNQNVSLVVENILAGGNIRESIKSGISHGVMSHIREALEEWEEKLKDFEFPHSVAEEQNLMSRLEKYLNDKYGNGAKLINDLCRAFCSDKTTFAATYFPETLALFQSCGLRLDLEYHDDSNKLRVNNKLMGGILFSHSDLSESFALAQILWVPDEGYFLAANVPCKTETLFRPSNYTIFSRSNKSKLQDVIKSDNISAGSINSIIKQAAADVVVRSAEQKEKVMAKREKSGK